MAVFSNWVREMSAKYKILWFLVDTHHRERYFFICGCNQIVTRAGEKNPRPDRQEQDKTR